MTCLCDSVVDPAFDVAPSEAKIPADAESWWAVVTMSPRVDGGHRHVEILSKIFDGQQLVEVFHVGNRASEGLQMDDRTLPTGPGAVCHAFVIDLSFIRNPRER